MKQLQQIKVVRERQLCHLNNVLNETDFWQKRLDCAKLFLNCKKIKSIGRVYK